MIQSKTDFIKYFESIRRRTMNYIRVVPADRLGWSPKEGEFTCADIIRHVIASEKMFVRVATEGRWKYEDHEQPGIAERIQHSLKFHSQGKLEIGGMKAMEPE